MNNLIKIAASQIGVKEISGIKHNMTIVKYSQDIGLSWINDDETPWCAIFVNWCLFKAKLPFLKSASARDCLKLGIEVNDPKPGDIVVFWRESKEGTKGHVGIFLGFDIASNIFCLGGNQGNQVSISTYRIDTVLGFRRVSQINLDTIPNPILRIGSRGNEVKKLQSLLNQIGCNVGKPDGVFGQGTANGIKMLQKKGNVKQDGIYGNLTRNTLESILQT